MISDYENSAQNLLGFHPATDETAPLHSQIRDAYISLYNWIGTKVPPGEERKEAQKLLRALMMWCNAGIAVRSGTPVAEDASNPHSYYQSEEYKRDHDLR